MRKLRQHYFHCLWIGWAIILLSGCVTPPHRPPSPGMPPAGHGPRIGQLQADGSNVIYNNHRVNPGSYPIHSGDNVSTGAKSRAIIRLNNGSEVILDQNTDPDFIQNAWCVLVDILRGRVVTNGPGICFKTPHADGVINSNVHIEVTRQTTTITVRSGQVKLKHPLGRTLRRSQQIIIGPGRKPVIRLLREKEMQAIFSWLRHSPGGRLDTHTQHCRGYAQSAVSQQQENVRRRCQFRGPRWSGDFQAHYNWCLQVPESVAERENQARAEMLRYKCRANPSTGNSKQSCQDYARTAVSQQRENHRQRCNLRGNRWSDNYKGHYRWCLGASSAQTAAETRARVQALEKCRKYGPMIY